MLLPKHGAGICLAQGSLLPGQKVVTLCVMEALDSPVGSRMPNDLHFSLRLHHTS